MANCSLVEERSRVIRNKREGGVKGVRKKEAEGWNESEEGKERESVREGKGK